MKEPENPLRRKDSQSESAAGKQSSVSSLIEDAVSTTYKDIIEIVSAKIEIAKLEVTEQFARFLSYFVVLTIALTGIIYLGAAFSIFIGEATGYKWLGYLIIGFIFSLIAVIFGMLRPDWLRSILEHSILKHYNRK